MDEDCVEEMLAAFASGGSSLSVVGPVLYLSSKPDTVYSSGGRLSWGGRVHHSREIPSGEEVNGASLHADWVDGAVMLISKKALDEAGWFDEDYFLYFEEVDLCTRLVSKGWQIAVASRAHAEQEPGNYTPYLRMRNHLLFWRKNFRGVAVVPAITVQFGRSCVGQVIRKKWTGPLWAARGLLDGSRMRGGLPPHGIFTR
jgi:GT2 family glycosyltransferase